MTAGKPYDNEIDVEELMAGVRDSIGRRKCAGEVTKEPDASIFSSSTIGVSDGESAMRCALSYLELHGDIQNYWYTISSHRQFIGKFLVRGRELVNGEVRRYVDPALSCQSALNKNITGILTEICHELRNINHEVATLHDRMTDQNIQESGRHVATLHDGMKSTDQKILDHNQRIEGINHHLKEISTLFLSLERDLESKSWFARVLEERIQKGISDHNIDQLPPSPRAINYYLFEERFRGLRQDIKDRQKEFLPYFKQSSHVLDIGCGRGEFLEIMREHEIGACGVDIDETMAEYCRSRGLEVELNDAVMFLQNRDDKSFDGIFIDQVAEHLETKYLILLLKLCYEKMKNGYYIIIETVNPLSFYSLANFYSDLSHIRPLHPETLKYLLEAVGFRDVIVRFSAPVPEERQLRKMQVCEGMDENMKEFVDTYNLNVDRLNGTLYGSQDYSAIGKK